MMQHFDLQGQANTNVDKGKLYKQDKTDSSSFD